MHTKTVICSLREEEQTSTIVIRSVTEGMPDA